MQELKDWERGKIVNRLRAQQQIDFSSIRIPGTRITPTNVDGLMDYHDIAWIGIEVKYSSEPVQPGQRIAFERLVQDLKHGGEKEKPVLFIIADHSVTEVTEDVDAGRAIVRAFTMTGTKWRYPAEEGWSVSVKDLVDDFLDILMGDD